MTSKKVSSRDKTGKKLSYQNPASHLIIDYCAIP